MTMTKREQDRITALKNEVRLAKAMRFTEPVARDLPPPGQAGMVTQGWDIRGDHVEPAWSNCVLHGWGMYMREDRFDRIQSSRGPRSLYTTEAQAMRALRCELELKTAEALAAIDARIEELAKK